MTKQIHVGGAAIGGGAPITIQSMTNTRTDDVAATLAQIRALAAAGCDIVLDKQRLLNTPDENTLEALREAVHTII